MTLVVRGAIALAAAWCFAVATGATVPEARGGLRAGQNEKSRTADTSDLEVLELRPNFFMTAGAGGHLGVQVGDDGVVVVDTGSTAAAGAVVAAIKKITARPIRYIINTSADPDHV